MARRADLRAAYIKTPVARLPPVMPLFIPTDRSQSSSSPSSGEFWKFFDTLPASERDLVNYGANGDVVRDVYRGVLQRNWKRNRV